MRSRRLVSWVFCLTATLWAAGAGGIDPALYLGHVKYLASEKLKGRGTGAAELDTAAAYIARQFEDFGLRPAGGGGYLQPFPVTTGARLGSNNSLESIEDTRRVKLKLNEQFRPMSVSSSGKVSGELVFVGYGITAPEYNYDDYAGIDVTGRLVLLFQHEPQEFDGNSVFAGKIFTNHSQAVTKAANAKRHGAAGVIMIKDRHNHPAQSDNLDPFSGEAGPDSQGIPFAQVNYEVAERWVAKTGRSLSELGRSIDNNLRPESFAISVRLSLAVDVKRKTRPVYNVAGYLEGSTKEYLIIGAHYDHIGAGRQFSMAPDMAGSTHFGADDNASGTAGVIELARWFSSRPKARRGILFLAFAAEEIGLLGSSHYVDAPKLPLEDAVAMINLDMIGRLREGKVYVGGTWTGSSFKSTIEVLSANAQLNLELSDANGYGSSDHFSFTPRHVPVLFFYTGMHEDYHRPSDTWDKINAPDAARLLDFVAAVSGRLLNDPGRPLFVRDPPPH